MQHIVSFSGGKDSTAMLLTMIEKGMQIDRIINVDTTKEFPEMYEHIKKVQSMIEPLKIEIVKIDFDYWFGEHVRTKGKFKGVGGGYGWPDMRNRWCTRLKVVAFRKTVYGKNNVKQIKEAGVTEFHGIAFDEPKRVHNRGDYKHTIIERPMIEWQMTEADALKYCYSKGLDWDGLYEKMARVSCFCCPLSRISELQTVYKEYPKLWNQMMEMDKKSFRSFRHNKSLSDLEKRFEKTIDFNF